MKVEFYEKKVKGLKKTVKKLHIKKTLQEEVTKVVAAQVVIRPATEQDKVAFKAELEAFLSKEKKKGK